MSTSPATIPTGRPRGIPKPSSKVPSLSSTSWAYATETTKRFILYRDGNACWFCAKPRGLNVAHLLPACDYHTFLRYQRMGLLAASTTHLAHEDNLITLCVSCHEMFDSGTPVISILPTNAVIQQIYNHEMEDYVSREEGALVGIHRPRAVLPIQPSDMRGVGYILSDDAYVDFGERFQNLEPVRPLKLHPVPLILRFAAGGIGPVMETPVTFTNGRTLLLGLPATTRSLIASLFSVWSRPDPSIVHSHPPPSSVPVSLPVPGEPKVDRHWPLHESGASGAAHQTGEQPDHEMTGRSMEEATEHETSPSLTMHSDASECDDKFLFGPGLSTEGIVEYFLTSGYKSVDPRLNTPMSGKSIEGERAQSDGDDGEVAVERGGWSDDAQRPDEGH